MDLHIGVGQILDRAAEDCDVLTVPRPLVHYMRSTAGAVFLAQLLAWSENNGDWVVRSYGQWQTATGLTPDALRRAGALCHTRGFLQMRQASRDGQLVVFCRLDFQCLQHSLAAFLAQDAEGMGGSPEALARLWQVAMEELQMQIPRETFDLWLQGCRLLRVEEKVLILGVHNGRAADWINHRLRRPIEQTVNVLARIMADDEVPSGPYRIFAQPIRKRVTETLARALQPVLP